MSKLTVIVPVWDDYVPYLDGCLGAIEAQRVGAHVIVVDNASVVPVDASTAGLTVVRIPRRVSPGAARNFGLRHVETEYVCFADADDQALPRGWQFLLDRLAADPSLAACAGQLWWWDDVTGDQRLAPSPRAHVYRHLSGRRRLFFLYALLRMALPTTTATIFRTSIVSDAGGYDDSGVAEDWALAAAVALRGRVELHELPAARVRIHEGSLFNRHLTRREVAGGMSRVRQRVAADPEAPWWVPLLLPLVACFHEAKAAAIAARTATRRVIRRPKLELHSPTGTVDHVG